MCYILPTLAIKADIIYSRVVVHYVSFERFVVSTLVLETEH